MAEIVTVTFTPPARADGNPWTQARLEESATETGSFTAIETVDLSPTDSDPTDPQTRSFTTSLATPGDWIRVVWIDADLNESDPSDPVLPSDGTTAYADAAELAAILKVNPTSNADALDRVLLAAAGEINAETGRTDLAGWELALAAEVNIERAVEHWQQMKSPFGIIGLGSEIGATHTSTDSWNRHAAKLQPLKRGWGIA